MSYLADYNFESPYMLHYSNQYHLITILNALLGNQTNSDGLEQYFDRSDSDLSLLLPLSKFHKTSGLFVKYCQTNPIISQETSQEIASKLQKRQFNKLKLVRLWLQIAEKLNEAAVDHLWLKGPTLSYILYNDPLLRDYGDIDLFIKEADQSHVLALLAELNLEIVSDDMEYHIVLKEIGTNCILELHTALSSDVFDEIHHEDIYWQNITALEIKGKPISTFNNEYTLVYLCHHGSRHGWECLQWLYDIAQFLKVVNIDWEKALKTAQHFKQSNSFLLGLYLSEQVFNSELPFLIKQEIQKKPKIEKMGQRFVRLWKTNDINTVAEGRSQSIWPIFIVKAFFMIEPSRDRIRYIYQRLFKKMNYLDKPIAVPWYLSWVYYIYRVFRLIFVYFILRVFKRFHVGRKKDHHYG